MIGEGLDYFYVKILEPFYFPFVIFVDILWVYKRFGVCFSTAIDTADFNGHYIGVQQLERRSS